jgi:cell fate regulator YaaT (PSP1 superfamily)
MVGQHVIVEADRGEDLGVVVSRVSVQVFNAQVRVLPPKPALAQQSSSPESSNTNSVFASDLKTIIRIASAAEISLLADKGADEAALLKLCRQKVKQRQFPMVVLEAEYQYDRNKLTFFFHASGRIDFRELVRDLFALYKTRIWMQQVSGAEGFAFGSGSGGGDGEAL